MTRRPFINELGDVPVNTIVIGEVLPYKLKVKCKKTLDEDLWEYTCEYIEGPFAGDERTIRSNMKYRRVN